ncbi:hypothetical protein ACFFV8_12360 [Sphingobium indicum]|uniref:hypothetical protein n=1 Tax=Sphingobium indicum TaxID=332055 RepID=UPI000F65D0EE|nr:hypothetical protein [Sphingobium indicum]
MVCETVKLPSGGTAIICSSRRRPRCSCGQLAPFLCDWKVPNKRSGTCDEPLCADCASSPTADKHLCLKHQVAFEKWKQGRARQ